MSIVTGLRPRYAGGYGAIIAFYINMASFRRLLWPVKGISGQPGCVRYCYGFKTPVANINGEAMNWTKQKLLSISRTEMVFSYSLIDGNVGFQDICRLLKLWLKKMAVRLSGNMKFSVNGWTLEHLDSFISSGLQVKAKKMAEALQD